MKTSTVLLIGMLSCAPASAQVGFGQPNSPEASFRVNGIDTGAYPMSVGLRSFNYIGGFAPALSFEVRGAPDSPFMSVLASLASTTTPTPIGNFDLDISSGYRIIDDGINRGFPRLDGNGSFYLQFPLAATGSTVHLGAMQYAVWDPTSPTGLKLTAATDLTLFGAQGTTWFVSHSTGSANNPGTESAPFASLSAALAVATSGDAILMEAGTYFETSAALNLVDGVQLIGGFELGPWRATYARSRIFLPTQGISADGINSITRVENMHFTSLDASMPSEASTALRLSNSQELKFANCIFEAGDGGDGRDGHNGRAGRRGCDGGYANAYERGRGATGFVGGLVTGCWSGEPASAHHHGGRGGARSGYVNGEDGEHKTSTIRGGDGGSRGNCLGGQTEGSAGDDGDSVQAARNGGVAPTTAGQFQLTTSAGIVWQPATPGDGRDGFHGMGGAGGGQQGGFECIVTTTTGDYGGGGGGGGNGGERGFGGGGGGPSCAAVVMSASVYFLDCEFRSGDGGQGGNGGHGGPGGSGGHGHPGQTHGGRGGDGGSGGWGSNGAGGPGGSSVGIWSLSSSVSFGFSNVTYVIGNPGSGGQGAGGHVYAFADGGDATAGSSSTLIRQ